MFEYCIRRLLGAVRSFSQSKIDLRHNTREMEIILFSIWFIRLLTLFFYPLLSISLSLHAALFHGRAVHWVRTSANKATCVFRYNRAEPASLSACVVDAVVSERPAFVWCCCCPRVSAALVFVLLLW